MSGWIATTKMRRRIKTRQERAITPVCWRASLSAPTAAQKCRPLQAGGRYHQGECAGKVQLLPARPAPAALRWAGAVPNRAGEFNRTGSGGADVPVPWPKHRTAHPTAGRRAEPQKQAAVKKIKAAQHKQQRYEEEIVGRAPSRKLRWHA